MPEPARGTAPPRRAAAVDDDRLPGHEGRGRARRGRPPRRQSRAARRSAAAACASVTAFSVSRILPERAGEIGPDQPRRDAVDAHLVRPELGGEVARELEVRRLGDVVGADHGRAVEAADRGDDDDRALPALEHLRRDHLDQPVVGDDIVVEDLAELLVADPRHRPVIGVGGGVADEDVDPAELPRGSRRPAPAAPPWTEMFAGDGDRAALAMLGVDRVGDLLAGVLPCGWRSPPWRPARPAPRRSPGRSRATSR